ncbi:uncharacterized protein LOC111713141 isoform X2 [Eurytemora carolleeae]|uniref:uncharacterized protein LOC111713141 isoform X2 n=1 Tax=Eurytemora carolleeae TaxID=1294199 RepID=UPI000C789DE8|nr:uncharacterized protein LOC111713141 isoform X2 [Eurytemora carolleeae]|eukprot:XP_023343713.1 uncharacterized protein LOC111713141 isoform X2 [Eurytemora affinis]
MPLSQEVQNRLATLDHQMKKKELTQKDLEFQEMMKALEMESAARVHSVRERKAEYCTSNATREKIAETYRNMELSSKAQNFEDWCTECECFHLEKLDDPTPETQPKSTN